MGSVESRESKDSDNMTNNERANQLFPPMNNMQLGQRKQSFLTPSPFVQNNELNMNIQDDQKAQ